MNKEKEFVYFSCLLERQLGERENADLSKKEVLREILNANFRKNSLDLIDAESCAIFGSKYAKAPKDGMFLFKVARRWDGCSLLLFFDTRTTPNYVWVEKVTDDDEDVIYKQITRAVVNALSKSALMRGWTARVQKFVPGDLKDVHLFLSACDYAGDRNGSNGLIIDMKAFRSIVIADAIADEVMALLMLYMKGKNLPKDIIEPLRAAKEAGAIKKVTKAVFKSIFGDILGNSISAIDKYMPQSYIGYDDEQFIEMKGKFIELVKTVSIKT